MAPPTGGQSSPQAQLTQALVFLLLVVDVLPYHRCVPIYRRYEVAPGPEVLADKVALTLSVDPGKVYRTLGCR